MTGHRMVEYHKIPPKKGEKMRKAILISLSAALILALLYFWGTSREEEMQNAGLENYIPVVEATVTPEPEKVTATPAVEATSTPVAEATVTPNVEVTATPIVETITTPELVKVPESPAVEATETPKVTSRIKIITMDSARTGGNFTATSVPQKTTKSGITLILADGSKVNSSELNRGNMVENATPLPTEIPKSTATPITTEAPKSTATPITTEVPKSTPSPAPNAPSNTTEKQKGGIKIISAEDLVKPQVDLQDFVPQTQPGVLLDGFEYCDILLNNNGNIVGMEYPEELAARKLLAISVDAGATSIEEVVRPSASDKDRLNGRFVRTKSPHEVYIQDGQVTGFSKIPMRLEVVQPQILEKLIGKPIEEITAADVVNATFVVEEVDGKYLAGHKSAPGFRGPLIAKLHLQNGRYLRVEIWNWETHYTSDGDDISLVFVMCSASGRTK